MSLPRLVCIVLAFNFTAAGIGAAPLNVEPVAGGFPFILPIGLTHAGDGSGRLFVVQQAGAIRILDSGEVVSDAFLNLGSLASCCGEQGLLGLAFHPNYESNGLFYVNYTDLSGDTVVARYNVSADPNVADPGSGVILLTIDQPSGDHNGGQLAFGPEGNLWIAVGDGGVYRDPMNYAQDGGTLLGKVLRIDVDSAVPYAIPADNPFISDPGTLDEIWALGLRNPWRFSFDRLTGDLFVADVGQNLWEEVNFEPATSSGGLNYGWRLMEGNHCFDPATDCNDGSLLLPIIEYSRVSTGCAVIGGYRYRGSQMPEHFGTYFFGDFCSGQIWGATRNGDGTWITSELLRADLVISAFGEDEDGELYVVDVRGPIYRLLGSSFCNVTLNQTHYTDGETVTVTSFLWGNLGETPLPLELKIWLDVPGIAPRSSVNVGADGSVVLPAGFSRDEGPFDLFTLSDQLPRGSYDFGCRFLDPVTGALLAEDVTRFFAQ